MARSIRASSALTVVAFVALLASPALAQQTDEAMAESLFREAKTLMTSGSYAEACPKLAESQRLDPGTGTLLALAFCHEKEGKVASAWAEYTSVLQAAEKAGQADRAKVAREHVAALEPELPKLTVRASEAARGIEGLEVQRDEIHIGAAALGTSSPVDPGKHVILATAQGYKPLRVEVTLAPAESREVLVPALEHEAAPAPPPPAVVAPRPLVPPPEEPARDGSGRRLVGYVVGGAGVVAIGVGSFFGVQAIQKAGDANSACPSSPCSNADAVHENDQAKTAATISTVTLVVGAVAVAAGAYLILSAPSGHAKSTGAAAHPSGIAPTFGGFTW